MEKWPLPEGWEWSTLGEVCEINPRRPRLDRDDNVPTSFVPMAAVDERRGVITDLQTRPYGEVRRGYTYFEEGDVLFAKITPSMQNGKSAIARGLTDGIGFGSTEFHVLRPKRQVTAEWVHLFVRQVNFREEAARHFRGAVGQQRVPPDFLEGHPIPVPPSTDAQSRIVARIEALFAELAEARRLHEAASGDVDALMDATLHHVFLSLVEECGLEPLGRYKPFITSGPRHWAKYAHLEGAGPLFLRVGNVGYASLELEDVEYLELPVDAGEKRARVQAGDVLVTITGTIGRCAVVPPDLPEAYINQHTALVRLELGTVLPHYLMWFVLSPVGSGQATLAAYGQTKPGLNLTQLRQLQLPLPASFEQRHIVAYLDKVQAQVIALKQAQEATAAELERLEQAILARAFRGEL